ncbi:hypothetical protein [Tunturiibacter lichenicola]|uniref:hypothetical protein n=1 Tax=Tunturiibacter lichenicola TaxID=2051959 RepID=UPI003D9B74C7
MPVLSSMRGSAQVFALLVLIVVFAAIGSLLFATHFVTGTITYVVDSLAARSGLSPFLVRAVVIVSTIPFFWAVARFTRNVLGLLNLGWSPLSLYSNIYGIIIVLYIAVFFFAMYWSSKDAYAYKYCADTPEGIFVSDGTAKDPVYGVESKPCSLLQIKELRNGKGNLQAPVEIRILEADHYPWFDGVTGRPRVWFALDPHGTYRFYDHPGNDPHSGQPLEAIRQDIIERLKQTEAAELAGKKQTSDAQTAAAKDEERRQLAAAAGQKERASLQAYIDDAQLLFDRGDFKGAKKTCDDVLARKPSEIACMTIRQHASVKLARQLVEQGRLEFQRGQFDEALWSAESAVALDPGSVNATKLRDLASSVKSRSVN